MILNTGETWEPQDEDIITWQKAYPAVDVLQELRAMESWLDANPTRRKTKNGIKRFCNSWLARAQDRGGSPMAKVSSTTAGRIERIRDMTTLDERTHNFTGDPAMRAFFLEKYGQCFENGQRYVR